MSIVFNKYDLDKNKLTSINNGIVVYSASGNDSTLYNTNRSIVNIEELPEHVKNAFINVEDRRFYSHNGYDLKRIAKSALVNTMNRSKSQGASTISQQLIKNAVLNNEKTYSRKIQELVLSIKMEKEFSKDEILEMYLNTIYFGTNAYGIENASKTYFSKQAKDLNLNEACCLAGLIKSPNYYSPIANYENAVKRKNLVAKNMLECGSISQNEYEEVIASEIIVNKSKEDNGYEKEAIFEACRLLNINERDLINKKYKIITFKQDGLQEKIREINNDIINGCEETTKTSLDSLSVVANQNGQVLAYYANSNYNLHNLTRQPASTLKPFAVYLPCFKHNILSPASQILDEEINYNGFSPKNADGKFHGYVSVRTALSQSMNIPCVKALDYLGFKKSKESLSAFGFNTTNSDQNLSLALGAVKNGVNVLSILSAYNTLANEGKSVDLAFVNKILDEHDNVIYSHEVYKNQVANVEDCYMITDILKDCAKTGTAKRFESLNMPIASKTGTASNQKGNTDLFNVAYTTSHCMLTWIADIDKQVLPDSMHSSAQPTEINKQICSLLYQNDIPKDFTKPANVQKCPFDLIELENKHILVQPNHETERYIGYDIFKTDNLPELVVANENFDFAIEVSKIGASISFDAKKNFKYCVNKKVKNKITTLKTIEEKNENVTIIDNDIFQHEQIEYYITNHQNEIISEIKIIKPKDYLINLFNNEVLLGKKRWSVHVTPR